MKWLVPEDQEPRHDIAERVFRGESNRETHDSQSSECGGDIDTQLIHRHDHAERENCETVHVEKHVRESVVEACARKDSRESWTSDAQDHPKGNKDRDRGEHSWQPCNQFRQKLFYVQSIPNRLHLNSGCNSRAVWEREKAATHTAHHLAPQRLRQFCRVRFAC